jgi:hypothetical protein
MVDDEYLNPESEKLRQMNEEMNEGIALLREARVMLNDLAAFYISDDEIVIQVNELRDDIDAHLTGYGKN